MEFRVDIKGDVSGATQGAAALRAEAAAARDTVGALSLLNRGQAALANLGRRASEATVSVRAVASAAKGTGLEVAAKGADALANAWTRLRGASVSDKLEKEQAKLSRLKSAQSNLGLGGSSDARAGSALQAEIDKSTQKVVGLSTRLAQAGVAGKNFKVAEPIKQAGDAAASATSNIIRYGAALAGIGSLGALTQMAIGWRNLGALQMIGMRATQDVRRLMMGTDSAPLVRAASMLEKNLRTSSVTGSALSGILQRGFGAVFGMLERGEPLIQGVFEGMVIGALSAEIALLRARVALAPLTVAIEDWLGSEDAMQTAAYAGAAGLAAIAIAAAAAAAEVALVGAAFTAVGNAIRQAVALYREWDSAAVGKSFYTEGSAGADKAYGVHGIGQEEAASTHAKFVASQAAAASGGAGTGKALADGMAAGMASGEGAVAAGAAKLVTVAEKSARRAADAHSPSVRFRKGVGKDMGTGTAAGIDDQAPAVQAAADRSLVPDQPSVAGAVGGGGGAGARGGPIQFTYSPTYNFNGGTPSRSDVEAAGKQGFHDGLRALTLALGLPLQGVA